MPWKKSEPMEQRAEFALKALKTENFRALCQEYGISTKTGYKWRERFLRQGLEGMQEDSRRPRSSPKQLSESQVCEMVKLKLVHRHWGPRKIRTLSGFDSDAASIRLAVFGARKRAQVAHFSAAVE